MIHDDAREGKWRGKWRMEWVANTLTLPRNMMYPALLTLMRTPRLPAFDWTEAPADLNGLVRFAERRNLFSARVPSRFKRTRIHNRPSFVASCKAHVNGLKICHCQGNIVTVWNVTSCSKGKKCKVVPVHAMKVYWGDRGIAPLILNLGTIWRWVVSFTPRPLYRWQRKLVLI